MTTLDLNMKYLTYILIIVSFSVSAKENCPLNGYWKSNEAMTLESFSKLNNVTKKQKEILGNDFFVKMYVFIECEQFTTVMDDWKETSPSQIVSVDKDSIKVKYKEFPTDIEPTIKEVVIKDDCYSIPIKITSGQFNEFFCKTSKESYFNEINSIIKKSNNDLN